MFYGSKILLDMIKIAFLIIYFPYFMIVFIEPILTQQEFLSLHEIIVILGGISLTLAFFKEQSISNLKSFNRLLIQVALLGVITLLSINLHTYVVNSGFSVVGVFYYLGILVISINIVKLSNINI